MSDEPQIPDDEDVVERCGDPCPMAPDLKPCLLPKGHAYSWHRSYSSSWPVKSKVQARGQS